MTKIAVLFGSRIFAITRHPMPSPFVHSLLPAACAVTSQQAILRLRPQLKWDFKQWISFGAISVLLANIPDIDVIPASFFPTHYQEIHRAWGHNIFSSFLWIYLGAWLYGKFVSPQFKKQGIWFSFALVMSHLVLDATAQHNLFGSNPAVPLFWPLSQKIFTLPVVVFETMDFKTTTPHLLSLPFFEMIHFSFWREIFQCELLPSLMLYSMFWLANEIYHFSVTRLSELRANRYGIDEGTQSVPVGKSF